VLTAAAGLEDRLPRVYAPSQKTQSSYESIFAHHSACRRPLLLDAVALNIGAIMAASRKNEFKRRYIARRLSS
jgi:hypothetical protein